MAVRRTLASATGDMASNIRTVAPDQNKKKIGASPMFEIDSGYRADSASRNSTLAKCIGAWPTMSTAGHTGMPVGTEATNAALAIGGAGSSALATAGAR